MLNRYSIRIFLLSTIFFACSKLATAQTDPLEKHLWANHEKSAKVQIYKATDGKFYGKVVWLKVTHIDGKPRTDIHNTDKSKRNNPLMGMTILRELKKTGEHTYEDGTIYDPKNGKTYSCKITEKGDLLDLRGYVGFSMLGRTTTWEKAD
jgi:uncharacterized protein (DUF2147 family)